MKKTITNYSKGEFHGYQEVYWGSKLFYRGNYKNHKPVGYEESHVYKKTRFHII